MRLKLFKLKLAGNSMRPFIKPGVEVSFRKISPGRPPEIGDVAAIMYRNGLLVHRIILIRGHENNREYFTKGDRRLVGDGWVGIDRLVGIVIREKRYQRIMDLMAVGFSLMLWCVGKLLRRRRR